MSVTNFEKFIISTVIGYIGAYLLLSNRGWAQDPHKLHGPVVNLNETRPKPPSKGFYETLLERIIHGLHHSDIHDFGPEK